MTSKARASPLSSPATNQRKSFTRLEFLLKPDPLGHKKTREPESARFLKKRGFD
jgi:hypothetical protein